MLAGIMYFFPNLDSKNALDKILAEKQMSDILLPQGLTTRRCAIGPGGAAGMLATNSDAPLTYAKERQRWAISPDGSFWLGCEAAEPVAPVALARKEQMTGTEIELADGQKWLIPAAVLTKNEERVLMIPRKLGLSNGKPELSAIPKYARLQNIADFWLVRCCGGDGVFDDSELFQMLADVLRYNYRIGYAEMLFLELVSTDNWRKILDALIDTAGYYELLKKKAPGVSVENSGAPA